MGLEPITVCSTNRSSSQLSYGHTFGFVGYDPRNQAIETNSLVRCRWDLNPRTRSCSPVLKPLSHDIIVEGGLFEAPS